MKRYLIALASAFVLVIGAGSAFAQEPIMTTEPVVWRHFNNSGINANLTTPVALDSSFISHSAARVDTTVAFNLMKIHCGFAVGEAYSDTTFAFKFAIAPAYDATIVTSGDSAYVQPQFSEDGQNWFQSGTALTYPLYTASGAKTVSKTFRTLNSCTYTPTSFYGAQFVRFIVTTSTNGKLAGYVTYNSGWLRNQKQ